MRNIKDLAAMAEELRAIQRLLEKTADLRQRRLLHLKAFQLLNQLSRG